MNETVFITGGATGIGKETAILFKKAGYNTVIGYNSSEADALKMEEEYGVKAVFCNLEKGESVERAINEIHWLFGEIKILVNCAGYAPMQKVFTTVSDEELLKTLNVNLIGLAKVTKLVIGDMLNLGGGAIVNVSSIWGLDGGSCEVAYSMSKGGVTAFTKALAKELGLSNIRVNEVAPGFIDTKMNDHLSEADKNAFCEGVALNRIGQPKEVANVIYFLATDQSKYITGQTIRVDGGKL